MYTFTKCLLNTPVCQMLSQAKPKAYHDTSSPKSDKKRQILWLHLHVESKKVKLREKRVVD